MPVYKRTLARNKVSWYYHFELSNPRRQFKEGGFASKQAAIDAEAARRLKESAAAPQPAELPKTLAECLTEWLADSKAEWSPKTTARYRELAAYLSPELTAMALREIEPLHLHREWKRLAESGGHTRKDKTPRPLSPKTVRNIAGVVSSAFGWAILYGLADKNPATNSKPPRGRKRKGIALSPAQTELLIATAHGQWAVFLKTEYALGARRGEVLALRWSDIRDGWAHVTRSLCQADGELTFKGTKTGGERKIEIPARTLRILEAHRIDQMANRAQFGPDYQADLDLIFAAPDGSPLRPDSVSAKISLFCRVAKLPKGASLHSLRHSHASQLIEDGAAIPEVSERLGHSDPRTTLGIYSHSIPGKSKLGKRWDDIHPEGKKQ